MAEETMTLEEFQQDLAHEIQEAEKQFNALRKQLLIQFLQKFTGLKEAEDLATKAIDEGEEIESELDQEIDTEILKIVNNKPHRYSFFGIGSPTSLKAKKENPKTLQNETDGFRLIFKNFLDIIFGEDKEEDPNDKQKESSDKKKDPSDKEKHPTDYCVVTSSKDINTRFEKFLRALEKSSSLKTLVIFIGHGWEHGMYFENDDKLFNRDTFIQQIYQAWVGHQNPSPLNKLEILFTECHGHNFKVTNPGHNAEVDALATKDEPIIFTSYKMSSDGKRKVINCNHGKLNEKGRKIRAELNRNNDVGEDPMETS